MEPIPLNRLAPRKLPRQARAFATLSTIFEATIQVLLNDEPARLTTTRVAERAGVSVGTMYQYFPNRQALLFAVNAHFLGMVADRVEQVCAEHHGSPIGNMVEALVDIYWDAKVSRSDVTKALYRSSLDFDSGPVFEGFNERLYASTHNMFASACDATYPNLALVNTTLLTVIFGAVRDVCQRNLPVAVRSVCRARPRSAGKPRTSSSMA